MTEVLKRGPGRPPNTVPVADALAPAPHEAFSTPKAAPVAPVESAKPKTIEVRVMRKYCPEFFVEEDGSLRKNGESGPFEYIHPETTPKLNEQGKVTNDVVVLGTVVRLPLKEARRILHIPGAAEPTSLTYRDDD
jgi:hypothetical protein